MTKEDWIKLAMPASITLLAVSIFTVPLIAMAQFPSTLTVYNGETRGWVIRDY